MSTELLRSVPWAALGAVVLVVGAYFVWALRAGLGRRPVLLGACVVAVLLPLYVALTWTGLLDARYLRFERPTLVPVCTVAVLLVAHRLLSLSARIAHLRRTLTELLLCVAALSAAAAALGVEIGKPLDRLAILITIDRSRSIDLVPEADGRIAAELAVAELGMRDDDRVGTIVFAAEAAVEDPLRPRTGLASPQRVELGRDGTDVGAAIRRALADVPADAAARIVLLSDGVSTRGNALDAAAAAVAAGVPVDVVPLDQASMEDVRVVAVRMPARASEGETLELKIVTSSTSEAPIEVRIFRDGELIRKGNAKISAGEDVLRLKETAPGPGLHRYDVEVTALDPKHDEAPEDNRGSTFLRVRGQSSVLVLEGRPALAAALRSALVGGAFQVDVAGPASVPADVAGFAAYDAIILSDIPASDLSPTQLEALATYVRDLGGGLLLMGGDKSLGPGGYGKTPIEEISPVAFDIKQERRRASLAEVIAIDYSGSMAMRAGKHTKLELANEASVRSAELLGPGDRLGVMHVDTVVSWTVPLGPVTDKAKIARQIRAVGPGGGGIYVDLTLEAAYAALARETVNLKHVLLFADGSDAEERTNAFSLVSSAKQRGITTSVVALGRGSDVTALERMSQLGDGRFYLVEDASRLPAVFAQETILAAKSSINETPFKPTLQSPGAAVRGIELSSAPALAGYVVTIPKGRAQVHLLGPEGDPVLATWSVGIGRSAAFTSDFKDRWGSEWTRWPPAARLFTQLVRDIARAADDPRVRLEADAAGGQLHVRATLVDDDGRAETFRRLSVRIGGPDGFKHDLPLEAVGAGSYAATLPLSRPGAYVATALDEGDGTALATTGAVLTAGEEMRPTGTDRALLGRIAEVTGGKVRDTLAGIFNERDVKRFAYRNVTPPLIWLAALALLFSVAARRLAMPEWLLRAQSRAKRRARGDTGAEAASPPDARERTLDALKERKARSGRAAPIATRVESDSGPASVPRFARAPTPASTPTARAAAPPEPLASRSAEGPRSMTAAEILLARRRGRRGG
ncbi:MAG: VWA domain-containing protein [Polyangiaceae bacterium]|nr:VWA domain-containing protein [Polyangiaceae bacterium]